MSIGKFLSENTSKITILILIIVFLVGGYFIYLQMSKKYNLNEKKPDGSEQQAEILFFFATWCPHCKVATPHWDSMKEQYDDTAINGYRLTFSEVDCSEESSDTVEKMETYNVSGFPTIILIKDGKPIEFDAKPTRDSLQQFLDSVFNK